MGDSYWVEHYTRERVIFGIHWVRYASRNTRIYTQLYPNEDLYAICSPCRDLLNSVAELYQRAGDFWLFG